LDGQIASVFKIEGVGQLGYDIHNPSCFFYFYDFFAVFPGLASLAQKQEGTVIEHDQYLFAVCGPDLILKINVLV
jgi:hypothetical protein